MSDAFFFTLTGETQGRKLPDRKPRVPFRPGRNRVRFAICGNTSAAKTMLETRLITTWRVMAAFTGQVPEVVNAIGYHGARFGRSGT